MNPKFWGPHAWIFLHSITMNYPKQPSDQDKHVYFNFFKSLEHVLPCEKCAYNYSNNLKKFSLEAALENRDKLIRWLISVHNEVNREIGKPPYTYDQVIDEYNYKMKNLDNDSTLVYKVIILALVVFICLNYFKYLNSFK